MLRSERESAAADLVQVRKKIERYLAAFEAGDLAADDVGARLRDLRSQEANLDAEVRRLDSLLEAEPITPTALELEPLRVEIEQVLCDGDPKQLKRLYQAMIFKIEVHPDGIVEPHMRAPHSDDLLAAAVRPPTTLVEVMAMEPTTSTLRT